MSPLRIAVVAGEASGDILGGGLLQALKSRYPEAVFEGIGGERMQACGLESLYPLEKLSVMGLVEVLRHLPELLGIRRRLIARWQAAPPDLFIGIDAPDFNLDLEQALKTAGIPTVHYVSPSVWAWKQKRIHKIKASADLLLALFPFEPRYYQSTGQWVEYIGHPLADEITARQAHLATARTRLGYTEKERVVALLPGSRASEVERLAVPFLQAASLLQQRLGAVKFVLPAANQARFDYLQQQLQAFSTLPVQLLLGQSQDALATADAVLIASGTATLEATLLKKPMVVAYKMSPVTYWLYSRMIHTPYVALPNILAGEQLVPELLQQAVTPYRLSAELETALCNATKRAYLAERFDGIFQTLQRGASEQAANAISQLLHQRQTDAE